MGRFLERHIVHTQSNGKRKEKCIQIYGNILKDFYKERVAFKVSARENPRLLLCQWDLPVVREKITKLIRNPFKKEKD